MTFQTNKNDPYNGGRDELRKLICSIWLGDDDRDRTLVVSRTTPLEAYNAYI